MPTAFRNVAPWSVNLDDADATPVMAVRAVNGAGADVNRIDPGSVGAGWYDFFDGDGLNIDGSGTPVVRSVTPETGTTLTIYALALVIQDASVGALSALGAVTGAANGITAVGPGSVALLGRVKTNADMLFAGDGPAYPVAYGGEYVWVVRKVLRTPIVLTDADSLSVTISDDLTGLTSAVLYAAMVGA